MIRLIIFDWDDVFTLGSTAGYIACYHNALTGVGIELDPAEERKRIDAQWGKSHREELAELLKEHPELLEKACGLYEANLFGDTFVNKLSIIPGIQDMLMQLSQTYSLALATGVNPTLLREKIMPRFRIPDVFSQIITAYDISDPKLQKPHPYSITTIIEAQGFKKGETLFVGDAASDIKMAKAAEVACAIVLTGHLTPAEARELQAEYILKNVRDIEVVLEKIHV